MPDRPDNDQAPFDSSGSSASEVELTDIPQMGNSDMELRHIVERGIGPGTFRAREVDPWHGFVERSSGLLVPAHIKPEPVIPTCIDLFCGCGGFSLGFIQAGFHVLAGVDFDVTAMLTYLMNLGGPHTRLVFVEPKDEHRWKQQVATEIKRMRAGLNKCQETKGRQWYEQEIEYMVSGKSGSGWHSSNGDLPEVEVGIIGDVRKLTGQFILQSVNMKVGELDCVIGSPPCQGFSRANVKRSVMDPRNSLVFDWARLVVEMRPKTCVFENVPEIVNMTTPEGISVIDALCRVLEDGGMGTFEALKKSLLASSGAGAMLRGKEKEKKVKARKLSEAER